MNKPSEKETDDALGCLFYIAIAFVIIGSVWAFGAYGMIGVGVSIFALIVYGIYRQERSRGRSHE
jgi:hypothetical protein